MIPTSSPLAAYQAQRDEIRERLQAVCESGAYVLGAEVERFEADFAAYCQAPFCIGVNSGTDALVLTLKALGVGPGDEVVTVAHTALATVAAVLATGATPVLVDIDPDYFTLAPAALDGAMSGRTKAIVPVHLYGQPADMDAIMAAAGQRSIPVVEDCAQATGATCKGRRVGSIGVAGCFSFYPTKNLGGIGDGGMVVTGSRELAERVRRLRQYGWNAQRATEEPGINSRLDEIQAAILAVKLARLDQGNARRAAIADRYDASFADLPLTVPARRADVGHVYHLYVVSCDDRAGLIGHLQAHGVMAGIHYPVAAHRHGGYADCVAIAPGGLAATDRLVERIVSLPMFPELTDADVDRVIAAVRSFFR